MATNQATIDALLDARDEFHHVPEDVFRGHLAFLELHAPAVAAEPRLVAPYLAKLCTLRCLDGKQMLELLEVERAISKCKPGGEDGDLQAELQLFANLLNAFDNEASREVSQSAFRDAASRDNDHVSSDYANAMNRAITMAGQ